MGLFGKKVKVPGIDTGALTNIATDNANKKRAIVGGLGGDLAPISANFEQKRGAIGADYQAGVKTNMEAFKGETDAAKAGFAQAGEVAAIKQREQAFRDVPEVQRAIRETLGGSGTLNTGAARANLAKPVINAVQSSADFSAQNTINTMNNNSRLDEKSADFNAGQRSAALETKFGLDKETTDYLTSIGRQDLIDKANSMLGIEGDLGDDKMAIEQARQVNDMAQAAAKASKRGAVMGTLGQALGGAAGFALGGPMGAGIGMQLGGAAANTATGSPTALDPTLLFAMAQRNRSAVVNGTRVPVRPY